MPIRSPELERLMPLWPAGRGDHKMRMRSILRLQQTVGNREVVRLMTQPPLGLPAVATSSFELVARSRPAADESPAWRKRLSGIWARLPWTTP